MNFMCYFTNTFSICWLLLRLCSWSRWHGLADMALCCFRNPFCHHASYQHLPVLSYDLLMHQEWNYRKGAINLWWLLNIWVSIWVRASAEKLSYNIASLVGNVYIYLCKEFNLIFIFECNRYANGKVYGSESDYGSEYGSGQGQSPNGEYQSGTAGVGRAEENYQQSTLNRSRHWQY